MKRPGSLATKGPVDPSQRKRASALGRSTDKPLLLPDISKGQGPGDEGLRRSPSLQDVPHPQGSLHALTNPTLPNNSGQPGSLRYTSQRDGQSGTDAESKDRVILDGDKQRVDFSETPQNEDVELEEVQEAWQQELQATSNEVQLKEIPQVRDESQETPEQ